MSVRASIVYDFETVVTLGLLDGCDMANKFGRNTDIDTGVSEDIWTGGGLYTGFPNTGTAEVLRVTSSSANDTAAGSGARTISITGLDGNYKLITETVTLNGTTPVTTTQSFWRAHTCSIQTSGGTPTNTAFNAGTITVQHNVTIANIFLVILPSTNQSNVSAYTIPAGYSGIIKRIHGAIKGGTTSTIEIALWIRLENRAPRIRRPTELYYGGELDDSIWGGIVLPEKTDIILRGSNASANNLDVIAGYDLALIKN